MRIWVNGALQDSADANISVLELRAFEAHSGERIYQFDTLCDEFEDGGEPEAPGIGIAILIGFFLARRRQPRH